MTVRHHVKHNRESYTRKHRHRYRHKRDAVLSEFPTPGPSQCHPCQGEKVPPQGCLPIEILQAVATKLGGIPPTVLANPAALRSTLDIRLAVPVKAERSFLMKLPISETEKTTLANKYLRP